MEFSALFVLLLTLAAAILLVSERLRPDLIALGILVVLGISGIVTPAEAFSGFGGAAVITILGVSIISIGLHQTGVTHELGRIMYRLGKKSDSRQILIVFLISATLSLVMNNVAAVGVLLPAVMTLSRRTQIKPSRLLLPLAYGSIMGGMATLLTTSNIIVSDALRNAGYTPFGLLDFFPIGGPIVVVGAVYILTAGRRMLPQEVGGGHVRTVRQLHQELANLYQLDENLYEIEVMPGSPLAGISIAEGRWAQCTGLNITGLIRNHQTRFAPSPEVLIREGDLLMVQGNPNISTLVENNLRLISPSGAKMPIADEAITLAELVIAPHAQLEGMSLRQVRFRELYNLNVLAIWRESKPIQTGIADIPLRSGDALLVQGPAESIRLLHEVPNLILLEEDPDAVLKPGKQLLALFITLLTLGVAAIGLLPVSLMVLTGALLIVLTRCTSMNDAYRGIEWRVIFLIAGMWPLSIAIRTTGLADAAINFLLGALGEISPLMLSALLIGLAFGLTQFMSGQVSSLVIAPLALAAAQQMGVDPRGMAMGVALGCSLAFPIPFGHPVNIMVMSSGGYTLRDYLRIGLPLTIIVFICILIGLKLLWGV